MRIRQECKVRSIAGENVVILQGSNGVDMTQIITLNDSALFLWNNLVGKDFLVEDVAGLLLQNFDVAEDVAMRDAQCWIDKMKECKLIE